MTTSRRKRFHEDFLKDIKERADSNIVEIVNGVTTLKKQGKDYLGICPFHDEATPSFSVSPQKNLAYCFGCSWGGNAIQFLMKERRVSFVEAVLEVARDGNIPIRYDDGSIDQDYPAPLPRPATPIAPVAKAKENKCPPKDCTVGQFEVDKARERLKSEVGDAVRALTWLRERGIDFFAASRYRLGLVKRVVTPDPEKPEVKEEYSAIAIFIPAPDRPRRFFVKKRVAPWLTGDQRPEYLKNWSQYGLPATIWFAHNPPDAQTTYFCEGEWDAILLGELAREKGVKVAVACSTSGAGTVPKPEQLDRLPGHVTIFYDRDQAGVQGAQKLAAALKGRATIGLVPMPNGCKVKGWDVSNAIQAGYKWEDFETAELTEPEEKIEVTPPNESGIKFNVLRRSLDQLLKIFPELETEAGKDWLKMRRFTPDRVVNSKYFDWNSDQPGTHIAVRSGLGTGKTKHVHDTFLKDDAIGANAFGYRNSLLVQFAERGNEKKEGETCKNPWYHLQQDLKTTKGDKDNLLLLTDPKSRITSCVDSLIHFQHQDFENKRLVLDELEGTFKHLYTAKTAVSFHRQLCKERIGRAIANSEAVILLDGNLTDLTVAHAERISGKKFVKVENLYRGNRGKVTLYAGTLKLGKDKETGKTIVAERRINDYSLLHKIMVDDREPFVCGSDSQEKLEAWHEILKRKGRKVFRLDSTNSNTPEAIKFLANPIKYIQENGIEIVLYSPTGESGLSIDLENYFRNSYYFFFGVVATNEQTQFIARPRDSKIHIHIFCQNQGMGSGKLDHTATQIQEAFVDYTLACSQISLSGVSEAEKGELLKEQALKLVERSNDAHFQYECHLKAREVFERNHLRKCLEYALHTAGYQVEVVTGCKVDQEELKAAQELVQVKKSKEIFSAQPLTDNEANDKGRKFDPTKQDKAEVARHRLVSRLPGIENKTITVSKTITLPQSAVAEIESGKVSLEIAQKLGIPTPETLSTQSLDLEHLPPDSLNKQGEGVPESASEEFDRSGGVTGVENPDFDQNETDQNQEVAKPETPTTQLIDLEHLPLNFSIKQGEGVPSSENGEVEFVITETNPIFDPEFIRKVKYQDQAWISKIELHFLLKHPEIAKLLQQKRWYKKLAVFSDPFQPDCLKRLNLTTYKSDWLKVHTLLEMGIEFFLNPESRWTQDSPEAVEFWEKGKDTRRARYIGITVGDSNPCEYIGRVLDKLDIKRKNSQIKSETGDKIRVYRVDTDYLASPVRSAVYDCVKQRIEEAAQKDSSVLNWDGIIENTQKKETDQNQGVTTAETLATQVIEVEHLQLNFSINQGEGVPVLKSLPFPETQSQIEEVVTTLPYCQGAEDLSAIAEGYPAEVIEDAIALQDTQPRRQELRSWLDQLAQSKLAAEQKLAQSNLNVELLREAIAHGTETVRAVFSRWEISQRWEAVLRLEEKSVEALETLTEIAPNWAELCDA